MFLSGLLLLLFLSSQVVIPKSNTKESGILEPRANGFLGEPDHTIDVLILGDSESFNSFVPLKMWKDCGITAYICGTPKQKLFYTEEFLHAFFEKQAPKIVILETNAIFREFSYSEIIQNAAEQVLPVFRYHDRWKSLHMDDLSFSSRYIPTEISKGYLYSTQTVGASAENHMEPSDGFAPISSKNRAYIQSILSFCQNNGSSLLLVSTPSTKNWNCKRHNSIVKLANQLEIPYLDMNTLQKEIPINWERDTRDKGDHLNFRGAAKATSYLEQYLWKTGLLTDHRGDARFDGWESALLEFNKISDNALV